MFVIKLVLGPGTDDTATLFVDPADAAALSGPGDASYEFSQDFSQVGLAAFWRYRSPAGNTTFDEIRIGTEAADMFSNIGASGTMVFFR